MSKLIDLTGQRFERLIVIHRMANDKHKRSTWLCECDCGERAIVAGNHLKNGNTKSCGCLQREIVKQTGYRNIKHGHKRFKQPSTTYESWCSMIKRCTNPNDKNYKNYGERNIKVCERWKKFENFLKDMGEHPGSGYSLDRKNNEKGYSKENCRWATQKQQQRNRRNNHLVTYDDKTQCIAVWVEETGINRNTIVSRLRRGWSIEKTLTTPVRKRENNGKI